MRRSRNSAAAYRRVKRVVHLVMATNYLASLIILIKDSEVFDRHYTLGKTAECVKQSDNFTAGKLELTKIGYRNLLNCIL
jgi:hypothetical protein